MKNYEEFVNENLFRNFIGKTLRSVGSFFAEPLNDLMKDISKSADPKKIINSLKTYAELNLKDLDKKFEDIKKPEDIGTYLNSMLKGLYSAIKGVEATQKVNKTYFDELFKKSDKNLVKVMSSKIDDIDGNLKNYVNNILLPGLKKISGLNKNAQDTETDIFKLKEATKKWIKNVFSPIFKTNVPQLPKQEDNKKIIVDDNGDSIIRKSVQGIVKKVGKKTFLNFRDANNLTSDNYPL